MLRLKLSANGLTRQLDSLFVRLPAQKASTCDLSNYQQTMTDIFRQIVEIPYSALICRDADCWNVAHQMALNMYANQISEALLSTARSTSSQSSDKRNSITRVPGLSEYVDPLRANSTFWRNHWVHCGSPRSGAVVDVMRRTRVSYNHAVRRVKLNERNILNILNDWLAESIWSYNSRHFWSEVKRLRGTRPEQYCWIFHYLRWYCICFCQKYRVLNTRVDFEVEMSGVSNDTDFSVSCCIFYVNCIVSCKYGEQAINRLNPFKCDGNCRLKQVILKVQRMTYRYMYHYFYMASLHAVQFRKSSYYVRLFPYSKAKPLILQTLRKS